MPAAFIQSVIIDPPAVDINCQDKGLPDVCVSPGVDISLSYSGRAVTKLPGYTFEGGRHGDSYSPLYLCPDLSVLSWPDRLETSPHYIGDLKSQMRLDGWQHELAYETDNTLREYLFYGVRDGFFIVDLDSDIPTYDCPNYITPSSGDSYDFVDNLISEELASSKYIKASFIPHCIHAIGAVPKTQGKYRPITDCRRPLGESINNFMSTTCDTFSYMSVDDVCDMISPGCYMATVDISAAYRSVSINPSQWKYQGVRWDLDGDEELLFDVRVCFGIKSAPFLFTQISNFVTRCMRRRGFVKIVNYLDDFLVFGDSFNSCQEAQMTLIILLGSLGFEVAWKKCSSPSTSTQYLGIIFDSISMEMSLPSSKIHKLHSELLFFENKTRATKRQLQRLCGVLAHCSKVVKGGRTFSRRIIDLLSALPDGNPRISLSNEFKLDMRWWYDYSILFNGVACLVQHNYGQGPTFCTDSSFSGYGIIMGDDWHAGYFNRNDLPCGHNMLIPAHSHWVNYYLDEMNINVLELFPILLAARLHGHEWINQHVICFSDNTQVVSCINRGTSINPCSMGMLREIFWLSATHNFHLTCRHIRGEDNFLPDLLSRIQVSNSLSRLTLFNLCCSGLAPLGSGSIGDNRIGMGSQHEVHPKFPVETLHNLLCR